MEAAEPDVQVERVPPQRTPEAPEQTQRSGQLHGVGNRRLGQVISRMRDGDGILAGGVVHPDVEAAISASRGRGQPLDRGIAGSLGLAMGSGLGNVRVHTDDGAAALARAVTARAFTVGNDIYFGRGEYRPATREGQALIAHEVVHTFQQQGAPLDGPLTVSRPGDALEREAEAAARDAVG